MASLSLSHKNSTIKITSSQSHSIKNQERTSTYTSRETQKFYTIIAALFYVSATIAVTEASNTRLRGAHPSAAVHDSVMFNTNSLLLHVAKQCRAAAATSLETAALAMAMDWRPMIPMHRKHKLL